MRRLVAVGFGVFLASILACGLNIDVADNATEVVLDAASMSTQISDAKSAFEDRLASSDVPDAATLAEREGLFAAFDGLEEALEASTACTDGLQLLIDRDKPSENEKAIGMTRRCLTLLGAIHDQIETPLRTLERWEALLDPVNKERAQARIRGEEAQKAIVMAQGLGPQLKNAQRTWSFKEEDLQTRFDDVVGGEEALTGHRDGLENAADVAALAKAVDGVEEIAAAALFGSEDLRKRLDTLGDTTGNVLVRLERVPQYWVRVQSWSWSSSTSGDGTVTDLGWQLTNREVYEAAIDGDGLVVEYTGSEEYGGSSTEVTDWDLAFATFATTFTRTGANRTEPVRAEIDADTFWDLYYAVEGMSGVFPDEQIVVEKLTAGFTDDDGIPYEIDMAVLLSIEQKFAGQYFDEATEVPSLDGTPLSAVGNEDFGAWEGENWIFTPAFVTYWKAGDWYKADSAGKFLSGYNLTEYARYRDWRREAGWGEQYDEDGNVRPRRHRIGSYFFLSRFGSHSVRGAGPSARSRGLGGGK